MRQFSPPTRPFGGGRCKNFRKFVLLTPADWLPIRSLFGSRNIILYLCGR